MNIQKLFPLLFFVNFSTQQFFPDLQKINSDCSECRASMIYYEQRLNLRLSNFSQQIQKCSDDLKTSNGPKAISDALDSFYVLTSQIQTVNNFRAFEDFETCKDINYNIILLDLEIRKMRWVIQQIYLRDDSSQLSFKFRDPSPAKSGERHLALVTFDSEQNLTFKVNYAATTQLMGFKNFKVTSNITAISRYNAAVLTQYSLALNRGLPYLSTLERSVYQIFLTTPSIISELTGYLPTLQICIAKQTTMAVLMNIFRTKYCQCLAQISWTSTSNDSQLQSNVNEFESRLITIQSRIATSASSAATLVKKASSETGNVYLPPLQVVLERQNHSDFPNTSWPNVQNCNDLFNRGKFLASKQLQYLQLMPQSNLDCSLISLYWNAINSTRSTSASLSSAMSAVKAVESNCRNYNSLLVTAFVRISVMLANVNTMGDIFCSCGSVSTTTLTSITSTTTTTTQEPCGALLSWDLTSTTVTPDLLGFPSGTYLDGTTIYPGVSNAGAACGNQAPGPVKITTVSTTKPRGSYYSCTNELFSTTNIQFYKNHPQLAWVPASAATIASIPGVIHIVNSYGPFQVGRIDLPFANGTFKQIGKIFNGNIYYIYNGVNERAVASGYEVLACLPTPITTTTLATTTGMHTTVEASTTQVSSITTTSLVSTTVDPAATTTLDPAVTTTTLVPASTTTLVPTSVTTLSTTTLDPATTTTLAPTTTTTVPTTTTATVPTTTTTLAPTTTTTLAPTTSTTTVSTTTGEPCGMVLPLSTNDPRNPATPGFLSGTFTDGSPQYVGLGNYATIGGKWFPASIGISGLIYGRNAYHTLQGLYIDTIDGHYYKAHPNMRWVTTTVEAAASVPNVIHVLDVHPCFRFITRHNFTYLGQTYQWVGARWINSTGSSVYFDGAFYFDGIIHQRIGTGTIEVLVCD